MREFFTKLSIRGKIIGAFALVMLCTAGLGAGMAIVRGVSAPVRGMTTAMEALARRDMAAAMPDTSRGDEIGGMARALVVFRDNMIEADRLAAAQEAERQVKARRAEHLAGLVRGFEGQIGELTGMLSSASTELAVTAIGGIGRRIEEVSQIAMGIAAAVEQQSTATGEIARTVQRTAQANCPQAPSLYGFFTPAPALPYRTLAAS